MVLGFAVIVIGYAIFYWGYHHPPFSKTRYGLWDLLGIGTIFGKTHFPQGTPFKYQTTK